MEENDIDPVRGMTWCKIHKYWWDTKEGCPDCKSDSIINKTLLEAKE